MWEFKGRDPGRSDWKTRGGIWMTFRTSEILYNFLVSMILLYIGEGMESFSLFVDSKNSQQY